MATTITKADLANPLNKRLGLSKQECKEVIDAFFDEIRVALVRGDAVKLAGFGNFELRDKRERPGRNPKTGEAIPITARRVAVFSASHRLRNIVDAEKESEAG